MSAYDCGLYQTSPDITVDSVIINQDPREVSNCVDAAETADFCFQDCYSQIVDAIKTVGALTNILIILFALLEVMLLISSLIVVCNGCCADYDDSTEEEGIPRRQQPRRLSHGRRGGAPAQRGQPYGGPAMNQRNGQRQSAVQMTRKAVI